MGEWEWSHAIIGGVATLLFLFQTIGTAHHDTDHNLDIGGGADFDSSVEAGDITASYLGGSIYDYLSVRNFVAFFMGYGWVTMTALISGVSRVSAAALGIFAGVVLVFISLYLIKTFLKFQESGTLDLKTLTGKRVSVYIAVGGSKSGMGKVMVDTASGRAELPARTNDPDVIPSGCMATILHVDGGVLWITAKNEQDS